MKHSTSSTPDWKTIGQREYDRLAKIYPVGTIRNILRAVKGSLIERSLDPAARDEVSTMLFELEKEFATGPALFILREADKAASHAERASRKVEGRTQNAEGRKPLR